MNQHTCLFIYTQLAFNMLCVNQTVTDTSSPLLWKPKNLHWPLVYYWHMPICHLKQKPTYMILLYFINVKIPKHCLTVQVKNRSDAGIKKIFLTPSTHLIILINRGVFCVGPLGLTDPWVEGTMFGNWLPNDTVSYPRSMESSLVCPVWLTVYVQISFKLISKIMMLKEKNIYLAF